MNSNQQNAQLKFNSQYFARPISGQAAQKYKIPLLLIVLHIPLGILLYRSSALALLHPIIVFFLGLYFAIRKHEKLERVAFVAAYLVGAEVLWRMAQSSIFWEFGKYGTAAIMIVALVRRDYMRVPTLPLLYFVFLIPSCFLTMVDNGFSEARGKLSFNMSGPLLLFICCWFFSYLKLNATQLKKFLFIITIPLLSIAVATLFFIITVEDIQFTTESNIMTSGGFGPNQVSSMLGLGVFVCLTCYLLFKNDFRETIYLNVLCILFAAQSVLTFSRGGIYNATGAALVVIVLQMRNLSQGIKKFLPIAGIGLVFLLLVFPYLDNFTGGKLQERFDDTGTTNRTEIIESDLQLFMENPIFGTGVGEATTARKVFLDFSAASHTEFSRLISEHGLFGIFALIALLLGTIYNYKRQKSTIGKALMGGAVFWTSFFMMNAGMRLAAPAFMWGLSFLTIVNSPTRRVRRIVRRPKFANKMFSRKKLT